MFASRLQPVTFACGYSDANDWVTSPGTSSVFNFCAFNEEVKPHTNSMAAARNRTLNILIMVKFLSSKIQATKIVKFLIRQTNF